MKSNYILKQLLSMLCKPEKKLLTKLKYKLKIFKKGRL